MSRLVFSAVMGALALLLGCLSATAEVERTAVLAGTVRRGPVTPVCRQDVPCDEPFAATFDVRLGTRAVGAFSSLPDGTFSTTLPAGDLTIVPRAGAPLMHPTLQARPVTTRAGVRTEVHLVFDTGIR